MVRIPTDYEIAEKLRDWSEDFRSKHGREELSDVVIGEMLADYVAAAKMLRGLFY